MTTLFADGFESNSFANWTSTTVSGVGTSIATGGLPALTGSFGARAVHNYTAADQTYEAKASKTVSPSATLRTFAQAMIRLTSVTSVGFGVAGSKAVLALRGSDGAVQAWFSIRSGGLSFSYRASSGTIISLNSNIAIPTNTIRYLRILIDRVGTQPYVEGWTSTDGITWTSVGSSFDGTTGATGVSRPSTGIDVGVIHIANAETGNYTIDADDVRVLDSIGATDWRSTTTTTVRSRFGATGATDNRSSAAARVALRASTQGQHEARMTGSLPVAMRAAGAGQRTLTSAPAVFLGLRQAMSGQVVHSGLAAAVAMLRGAWAGAIDWRALVSMRASARTTVHTVNGAVRPPATVVGSDIPWGTSHGDDRAG